MKIELILEALDKCFVTEAPHWEEPLKKKQRANRKIEDLQIMPIVVGVGLAKMHGFKDKHIMDAFDIEFEEELKNKNIMFSEFLGSAVANERRGKMTEMEKRFMVKLDLVQQYIHQRREREYFPIENYV
jgi:hypothetical protein